MPLEFLYHNEKLKTYNSFFATPENLASDIPELLSLGPVDLVSDF